MTSVPDAARPGDARPGFFDDRVDFFEAVAATPTHRALVDGCLAPLAAAPSGPALDLGCGAGEIARRVLSLGRRVVGCDLSAGMCRRAKRRAPAGRFLAAACERLPLADGSFAAATAMLVLHLTDLPRALAEIARVLAPGGVLACVTQSTEWSEAAGRAYADRRGFTGTEREFCVGSGRSGELNLRLDRSALLAAFSRAGFVAPSLATALDGGLWIASARRL